MDLNGNGEKILYSFENDDYNFQYFLSNEAIHNDIIYYSYYGASSEIDYFTEHLAAVDGNGHSVEEINAVFQYFFTESENLSLFIVCMCEELNHSVQDGNSLEILTSSMGKYCICYVDTKQKEVCVL